MLRLEAKQKMLFTVIYLIFQFLKLITESRNLNVWCYISSVKICQMTLFLKNEQKSIKKGLLYPLYFWKLIYFIFAAGVKTLFL